MWESFWEAKFGSTPRRGPGWLELPGNAEVCSAQQWACSVELICPAQ